MMVTVADRQSDRQAGRQAKTGRYRLNQGREENENRQGYRKREGKRQRGN